MIESAARRIWIELRRNEYRWLFLLVAAGTALALTDRVSGAVTFWPVVTIAWRNATYALVPWTAGVAAWTASRDRRHGVEELLRTMPRSPFSRRISAVTAVALLGIGAFALIGIWLFLISFQRIAGTRMEWMVIVASVLAVVAAAVAGYAVGVWKPRRATAFLCIIGIAIAQIVFSDFSGWVRFLAPTPTSRATPWLGVAPVVAGWQTLFFTGLAIVGIAALGFSGERLRRSGAYLAAGGVVVLFAFVGIVSQRDEIAAADAAADPAPLAAEYSLICSDGQTVVCVHPLFEPMLDLAARRVEETLTDLGNPAIVPARIDFRPVVEPGMTDTYLLTAETPDDDLARALDAIRGGLAP